MSSETNNQKKPTDLLRQDFKFVQENIKDDPSGFWSRTFIKTTVSLIEAEIFILKQETLFYCRENNIQLSPELSLFLDNKKYEISSNGQIKERLLQVRLKDDIRFIFGHILSIKGHAIHSGYGETGWSKVISTIAVRNRLTHPKSIGNMIVSKLEVNDCSLAFKWCIDNLVNFLEQEKSDLEKRTNKRLKGIQTALDQLSNERPKGT